MEWLNINLNIIISTVTFNHRQKQEINMKCKNLIFYRTEINKSLYHFLKKQFLVFNDYKLLKNRISNLMITNY